MNHKPLISVIITNYNYAEYIAKAIKSVLKQSYSNIELIIINDGSTDDSDSIIKKLIKEKSDRNIKYINRENLGVVYSRNEGIKIATGEYICYLDADDYFNSNYISKSYKVAKEFDADVIYPNWHFVGDWLGRPDTDFPEFKPELLQLQELHCTPASLIRKKAIGTRQFEVEKVAEDWDFFIGMSLDGAKFKLAKDNYINYRIRKGTRSSSNDPKEDTRYFVEILEKYKAVYGDRVIDPSKLVSSRHPNIIKRVLRAKIPRTLIESVKKDGAKATGRKIARKVARNEKFWGVVRYSRNKNYRKFTKSIRIKKSQGTKLAIIIHLYYPDLWPVIKKHLKIINVPYDLFVSVQSKDRNISLENINEYHKATKIIALPNLGRDILPFLEITKMLRQEKQYKYLLKLHSKKSPHRNDGDRWLNSLLDDLIPNDISEIIKTLENPKTGAVGPGSHIVSLSKYMGGNKARVGAVLEKFTDRNTIDDILSHQQKYPFFGGTMFWCRIDYLYPLLQSDITPADFNAEGGQVDGTTAHAIERILGKTLHRISNKRMYISKKSKVSEVPEKGYRSKYQHVD